MKHYLLAIAVLAGFTAYGQTTQGNATAVISEIMYNPPETNADSLEFIELHNPFNQAVDLSGWQFTKGILYTFPAGTILQPQQYLVLCSDSLPFLHFYGFSAHEYDQALNNTPGDTLELRNASSTLMDFVAYKNSAPWPVGPPSPAGGGTSIEFCQFTVDNNDGTNWSVSSIMVTGGTSNGMVNGTQVYATPGTGCNLTQPPIVTGATATGPTTIEVVFSVNVNNTAQTTGNYTGVGTVTNASVANNVVTLTLASPLVNGVPYTLNIANVQNSGGTPMATPQNFLILFNNSIADIQITEIMYNNPGSDDYEFIEIYNRGNSPAYVGGYTFTAGVDYTFPPDTIAPGGFFYLTYNASIADNFYNFDSFEYTGNLSNTGEKLQIENTVGDVVDSLTYSNAAPWPTEADGNGSTITLCNATNDNSLASSWGPSLQYIGNVGVDAVYATINSVLCLTGLNETATNYGVKVAPNPVENDLYVYINGNSQFSMQVYDVTGKLVYTDSAVSGVNTYSIAQLPAGLYVARFVTTNSNSAFAVKFLKK